MFITPSLKKSLIVEQFQGNYVKTGVTVLNNFTKRRQNGFKIGTRDRFATHLR